MEIKLFAAVFGVVSAVSVFADVLRWQVAPDASVEGVALEAARLVCDRGNSDVDLKTAKRNESIVAEVAKNDFPGYADLTDDYTAGFFFIELVPKIGDGGTWPEVARSGRVSYDDLDAARASWVEFNVQWSSINAMYVE